MSKKIWRLSALFILVAAFLFTLGFYCGKSVGIAKVMEIVLSEEQKGIDSTNKLLMNSDEK